MTHPSKPALTGAALLFVVTLGGCVSRSEYDAVVTQNKQLQQQVAAQSAEVASKQQQINRLQGAIKYTVNSDLLFPSGGWQMSDAGKRIIAGFAQKLAPTQENKLLVHGYTDNQPIGPALRKQGITSNEVLSQKRAENVMEFLISQGVKPDLVAAKGFGDANPIASNATAAGRAKNRRVELTLGSS
jgi:chemotaxis protein MotB